MPKTIDLNDPMMIETSSFSGLLNLPDDLLMFSPAPVGNLDPEPQSSIVNSLETRKEHIELMQVLSRTHPRFYNLYKEDLPKLAAEELMDLILTGEVKAVLALVKRNPSLLFVKTRGLDLACDNEGNRRVIESSPFRAILGAGDIDMFNKINTTCPSLLYENKAIVLEQWNEQFPPDYAFQPYDFGPLVDAIDKEDFINATLNQTTQDALSKFREHFKLGTVKKGYHFDLRILIQAIDIYFQYSDKWKKMSKNGLEKCYLFWRCVYGYLQSLVSTNDAQAILYSLTLVVKDATIVLPERKLKFNDGVDYYRKPEASMVGLGFDFWVYSYWEWVLRTTKLSTGTGDTLKIYVEQKLRAWGKLETSCISSPAPDERSCNMESPHI